jgi:hypothetical protein
MPYMHGWSNTARSHKTKTAVPLFDYYIKSEWKIARSNTEKNNTNPTINTTISWECGNTLYAAFHNPNYSVTTIYMMFIK